MPNLIYHRFADSIESYAWPANTSQIVAGFMLLFIAIYFISISFYLIRSKHDSIKLRMPAVSALQAVGSIMIIIDQFYSKFGERRSLV